MYKSAALLLVAVLLPMLAYSRPMNGEPMFGAASDALDAIFRADDYEAAEGLYYAAGHGAPSAARAARPGPFAALHQEEDFGSLPAFTHPTSFATLHNVDYEGDLTKASLEERQLVVEKFRNDFRVGPGTNVHFNDDPSQLMPLRRFPNGKIIKRHVDFVKRMRGTEFWQSPSGGPGREYVINGYIVHHLLELASSSDQVRVYYVMAVPLEELARGKTERGRPSLAKKVIEVGQLVLPLR
ncbi:uncharacterized protein PFL1_01467 [Pseudozyma flocculosa PF-1]|uniref:uncharacterized protein n=1 Tax=Pseudozyma flocculosa PF-1 TaxID=1277687 RepID=UPI0004560565|nr:uncharacterized protein PFL1_01467 [Pseudozyma flocculosa PF-1]EPQ31282.1 hypothetical protein PFL1_01467 [Pseudozyma flocculosa PF-1]